MTNIREHWRALVRDALEAYARETGAEATIDPEQIIPETPPKSELGDIAFPLFPFAKVFRKNPAEIASRVAGILNGDPSVGDRAPAESSGPYLNIRLDRARTAEQILAEVASKGEKHVHSDALSGVRIMVEFSCPNTNKPLHLGHLRNDALGESVSRLLEAAGATVRRVNLINDRGIHICQSMLAYKELGEGQTPESAGRKSDHFVGDWYIAFQKLAERDPDAKERAAEMLRRWEQGDPETEELWKTMNRWAISGIEQTYEATGVHFDSVYFESETYQAGREEVLKGLEQGIFYRDEEGTVWVDLEDINLDKKVLLRADGTSLYVTQDIGTAIARQNDWPFDRLVYVVASEQRYHFAVLFAILERLGFEWAKNLFHLSYGMVNLPEGRMKSRQGTVVDADDLLANLEELARNEIVSKGREDAVGDVHATSTNIAVGALHYYLLSTSPNKDMVFDAAESISFSGNTGPYLQYMGARISSMIRKSEQAELLPDDEVDVSLLSLPEEWDLLKAIAEMPATVASAAQAYNPSAVTGALYDLAKLFSRYYHDHPILTADDVALRSARMRLARAVRDTLRGALPLAGVPFLDRM
ncbi:MAG: arginine--tRNA ligase [Spirochaetales bacterium]